MEREMRFLHRKIFGFFLRPVGSRKRKLKSHWPKESWNFCPIGRRYWCFVGQLEQEIPYLFLSLELQRGFLRVESCSRDRREKRRATCRPIKISYGRHVELFSLEFPVQRP